MIYNNLISMTNTWVGQEKMGAIIGLVGLHLVMAAVVVLLFMQRMSLLSLRRWRSR
jgi:lipopolysaccharide export system permease protein